MGANGESEGIYDKATEVLRLEEDQADRLFLSYKWPGDLFEEYLEASAGSEEMAQVVARRIDRFIETEGRE